MQIQLPMGLADGYRSPSQRVRVVSEAWVQENLFCVACDSDRLQRERANAKTLDFRCVDCAGLYELKSSSKPIRGRLPDGAYQTMRDTMRDGRTPHLLALQYDVHSWAVSNLLLIPGFVLTPSAISCRKPLASTARRAGWIGCDILLGGLPPDARVQIVADGKPVAKAMVREGFARLAPLAALRLPQRGWTLDVLNVVRQLRKTEFSLGDVLQHEGTLQKLHPDNRHVHDKIRQQLQVLRDLRFLTFIDNRGRYRLR